MKPETARGARKLLPRRKRDRSRPTDGERPPAGDGAVRSTADPDFDPVEFAEFLEADPGPLSIDPGFRARLRERLWEIVREGADRPGPPERPLRRRS